MASANCEKHPFEFADAICAVCGYDFCPDCLLFVHGPKKPPMCVSCALIRAGVRCTAPPTPKYSPREMRARRRALKRELRQRPAAVLEPELPAPPAPAAWPPATEPASATPETSDDALSPAAEAAEAAPPLPAAEAAFPLPAAEAASPLPTAEVEPAEVR